MSTTRQPRWMTGVGWGLTILLSAALSFSATMKFLQPEDALKEFDRLGWTAKTMFNVGFVELACALVFVFPKTAILGAILLTGYAGGATATHVRIGDPWFGPVILGVLVWLAVFLREPRLRVLLPFRNPPTSPPAT